MLKTIIGLGGSLILMFGLGFAFNRYLPILEKRMSLLWTAMIAVLIASVSSVLLKDFIEYLLNTQIKDGWFGIASMMSVLMYVIPRTNKRFDS